MPLSIRPESVILDELLSALTRGGLVTDIAPISVTRMLASGVSMTVAELYYALYTLYRSFFLTLATGSDLDVRGSDMGLPRDTGQPASGDVVFTRAATYQHDIVLLTPQHLQPVVPPGEVAQTYSTIADGVLEPCGRSVSNEAPLTSTTVDFNDTLTLNLDGDGPQTITLGTQTTGPEVAAALQVAVRLLFAHAPALQPAYDRFRCDWNVTTVGAYTLRSGNAGPTSSVVVTPSLSTDASPSLKLGGLQGGRETPGMDSLALPCLADSLGVGGNLGGNQLTVQRSPAPGVAAVTNPLPFVDGRDIASDDAYRQDVQAHLLALGRGTSDGVLRAAETVRLPGGTSPVQSAQVLPRGDAHVAVYVSDGRSLTLGAQPDVVQAVQDDLDGRAGSQGGRGTPGGWIPSGVTALVRPATVRVTHVYCLVTLGPGPDLVLAQRLAQQALTRTLAAAHVGQTVGYVEAVRAVDQALPEVLRVDFLRPAVWSVTPQQDLIIQPGDKLMPGTIIVEVHRG